MRSKNTGEDGLLAQAIADFIADIAARREMVVIDEPWRVPKYVRLFDAGRGRVRVVMGFHCMPSQVDLTISMTSGDQRVCTFEGTVTWPDVSESQTRISGAVTRDFFGRLELVKITGLKPGPRPMRVIRNPQAFEVQPDEIPRLRDIPSDRFRSDADRTVARWLLEFAQDRGRSWEPFTQVEVNHSLSQLGHPEPNLRGLVRTGYLVRAGDLVLFTEEFAFGFSS